MGWLAFAIIGVAAFAALHLLGVPRALSWFSAAALMLGGAGYALQQRATLPGHPVRPETRAIEIDPGLVAYRAMIMPAPPATTQALAAADARLRIGDTAAAVRGLEQQIAREPGNAVLWTGLGSAIAAHDGGQVSPAALFAFRRAWQLAPRAPGPPFFLGMAYVQSGDLPAAKTAWLRALTLTPRDAPWRIDIAERLVLIDDFQAMTAGAGAGMPPR